MVIFMYLDSELDTHSGWRIFCIGVYCPIIFNTRNVEIDTQKFNCTPAAASYLSHPRSMTYVRRHFMIIVFKENTNFVIGPYGIVA